MRMWPVLHQISGVILVLVGLVVLPIPIPLGLLMITVGLALLAPYMPMIQRILTGVRAKWPKIDASLLKHRDRLPMIIRRTIDETDPGGRNPAK